jgi:drug/metabolite transporter (DMT)-like permease
MLAGSMAAVLALLSAVAYGSGDFMGGLASRRIPAAGVVLRTHVAGLVTMVVVAALVGAEHVARPDLVWGAVAGVGGGVGVLLFYRALAAGAMSVLAPITGVLSAIVPVVTGFAQGERPSTVATVGVVLGLAAVGMVSRETPAEVARVPRSALVDAVGAGFAFGLFFTAIAQAGEDAGLWPVVMGRVASVTLFGFVVLVVRSARTGDDRARRGTMPLLLIGCGVFDAGANALFLLARHRGLLSLVAVLGALYPAATILLARLVLDERMNRIQLAGLAVAGTAVSLVALG